MADPYLAEIRIWACNFAPRGWAMCNGQLMAISQNTALFSLLGTNYGGNGQTTFGLPDLRGSVPISQGQGPGLSDYSLGEIVGSETVTLLSTEMPAHPHGMMALPAPADRTTPVANSFGRVQGTTGPYVTGTPARAMMAPQALPPAGGSQPHDNMMPYLCVSFIISLFGIFPHQ